MLLKGFYIKLIFYITVKIHATYGCYKFQWILLLVINTVIKVNELS